jgi:DtxR family Mn-dependent transcriptional regulator
VPSFNPSSGTPHGISPSLEQYIEAIADLLTRDKVCSVSQVAQQAKVSAPAASRAIHELAGQGIVEHRAYRYVDLTPKGLGLAKKMAARHAALYDFLKEVLHFDEARADQEACRLEHQVDEDFAARLSELTRFFGGNKTLAAQWLRRLKRSVKE